MPTVIVKKTKRSCYGGNGIGNVEMFDVPYDKLDNFLRDVRRAHSSSYTYNYTYQVLK